MQTPHIPVLNFHFRISAASSRIPDDHTSHPRHRRRFSQTCCMKHTICARRTRCSSSCLHTPAAATARHGHHVPGFVTHLDCQARSAADPSTSSSVQNQDRTQNACTANLHASCHYLVRSCFGRAISEKHTAATTAPEYEIPACRESAVDARIVKFPSHVGIGSTRPCVYNTLPSKIKNPYLADEQLVRHILPAVRSNSQRLCDGTDLAQSLTQCSVSRAAAIL